MQIADWTVKAIVGLGNPGIEYKGTRHNVGFEVVDELARRWAVTLKKWKSVADLAVVKDRGVVLVEPRTFMNASGQAIQAVMTFYKVLPTDVLVVVDEVQLPLGRLRIRRSGSSTCPRPCRAPDGGSVLAALPESNSGDWPTG